MNPYDFYGLQMNPYFFYGLLAVVGLAWWIAFVARDGERSWAENPLLYIPLTIVSSVSLQLAMGIDWNTILSISGLGFLILFGIWFGPVFIRKARKSQ